MVLKRKRTFIITSGFAILLLLGAVNSFSQSASNPEADFAHLDSLWLADKISKKEYIDSVETNAIKYFREGITLKGSEYKKLLSLFYALSNTSPIDTVSQIKYYNLLENNASLNNKYGEAFYYRNKIIQLNGNDNDKNFKLLTKKLQYYTNRELYSKVAEEYKSNAAILDQKVSECLKIVDLGENEIGVLVALNFAAYGLSNTMDTTHLAKITQQAKSLEQKFLNSKEVKNEVKSMVIFFSRSIPVYITKAFEKNAAKGLALIEEAELEIKKQVPAESYLKDNYKSNFYSLRMMLYIMNNQVDSAELYLQLLDTNSGQLSVDDFVGLSGLYANKKDYFKANEYHKKAVGLLKDRLLSVEEELEDLLNAYIESEESKQELIKAEEENTKKAIIILIISFVAILIVLLLYLKMRKKDREMKNRIELLNYQASMQINELEERKNKMQENLGRDLHDNLASLLAGIKNKIEYLNLDIEDYKLKSNLENINLKIEEAYLKVRNKSHDLYQEGFQSSEQNFEKRIKQLIDFSLPDNQFEKNVLIDDGAINLLNTDGKIELLKIIQEIITNVIKHAKANKISIVIYEDEENFNMAIKDNGKGYDTLKKSGLGINSIKTRVQKMGGKTNILSNSSGTEVNIILPGNIV